MSALPASFLLVEDSLLDRRAVERGLREVMPDARPASRPHHC